MRAVCSLCGRCIGRAGRLSLPLSISNGGVSTAAVQWTFSYSPTDFSSGTFNVGPVTCPEHERYGFCAHLRDRPVRRDYRGIYG